MTAPQPVDFRNDVHPILVEHCAPCHGPQRQRAMLRLDARAPALLGGKTGPAIVPGDAAHSRLIERVTAIDPRLRMPKDQDPLSPGDLAKLRAWIDAGAVWPDDVGPNVEGDLRHWSFRPVDAPTVPRVDDPFVTTSIDAFVARQLRARGVAPAPEADRRTLLRRVTLDLTGLPPTPQEVDAFVADASPDAYANVVDRLLATDAYAERQARHWLDLARYADSDGYAIDAPRTMWRYRDWVIDAYASDMPFDRFTIEQLAGDLLPRATQAQRIATGFHRNTMRNDEGGVDPEEFRIEAVKDRVGTTATVWLGLTMACAQCHDHKYDPLTQEEFYRLYAFFDGDDDKALLVDAAAVTDRKNRAQVAAASAPVLARRANGRVSRVHEAGDFTRPGKVVVPGVPAVLHPFEKRSSGAEATRLDLAHWLVDPANPLTARVTVNRVWQQLFGRGLVATEEDFGSQGAPPTHPELLDHLAAEFVADGWSHRRLLRRIVLSSTYRQASLQRPDLAAADPDNELLARQVRLRLDAEIVRDVALAASGLLTAKVGGPSVFPPQPDGVLAQGQVERKWNVSDGADRYRRGLYTFRYRGTPYPALAVFDAPSGIETCTRRLRSNTPLQALTLLNDAAFHEAAVALAARIRAAGDDDAARTTAAFAFAVQRPPTPAERAIVAGLLASTDGDWVAVARVMLNLDETITRE